MIDDVITELQNNNDLIFYNDQFTTNLTAENSNSYNLGFNTSITPEIPLDINLFRNNIYNLIETNIVGEKQTGRQFIVILMLIRRLHRAWKFKELNPIKKLIERRLPIIICKR